jgi:fatty acid desaturase
MLLGQCCEGSAIDAIALLQHPCSIHRKLPTCQQIQLETSNIPLQFLLPGRLPPPLHRPLYCRTLHPFLHLKNSTLKTPTSTTIPGDLWATEIPVPEEIFLYYGHLDWLCYNVVYHNDHHDFPFFVWTRLPESWILAEELY